MWEKKIDKIERRIYPFEKDGVSDFVVATENEMFEVKYCALDGRHTVYIEKTEFKVHVVLYGDMQVEIEYR